MNKGSGVGLGGVGGGVPAAGPTQAAAVAAAQKQNKLLQRLEENIANIVDNFSVLVNVARVNDPPYRNSQEAFQMEVRAARVVQAADSLLKLISELKQTAIFSGFASLSDHVKQRKLELGQQSEKMERLLAMISEQMVASLKDIESHYYSCCEDRSNMTLEDTSCKHFLTGVHVRFWYIFLGGYTSYKKVDHRSKHGNCE